MFQSPAICYLGRSPGVGLGEWVCLWGTSSNIIPKYQTSSGMDKLPTHCVCARSAQGKHKQGLISVYSAAVECRPNECICIRLLAFWHVKLWHCSWNDRRKTWSPRSFIDASYKCVHVFIYSMFALLESNRPLHLFANAAPTTLWEENTDDFLGFLPLTKWFQLKYHSCAVQYTLWQARFFQNPQQITGI